MYFVLGAGTDEVTRIGQVRFEGRSHSVRRPSLNGQGTLGQCSPQSSSWLVLIPAVGCQVTCHGEGLRAV